MRRKVHFDCHKQADDKKESVGSENLFKMRINIEKH